MPIEQLHSTVQFVTIRSSAENGPDQKRRRIMRSDGEERRRYPRSRRGFPAIVDESGPGVLNHIDNISGNGILCHTV